MRALHSIQLEQPEYSKNRVGMTRIQQIGCVIVIVIVIARMTRNDPQPNKNDQFVHAVDSAQ